MRQLAIYECDCGKRYDAPLDAETCPESHPESMPRADGMRVLVQHGSARYGEMGGYSDIFATMIRKEPTRVEAPYLIERQDGTRKWYHYVQDVSVCTACGRHPKVSMERRDACFHCGKPMHPVPYFVTRSDF